MSHDVEQQQSRPAPEQALAAAVRQLRKNRGWSQSELAAHLADRGFPMHQTTIAKLEAGERPIRLNEAAALAGVFEVSLYSLISGLQQLEGDLATLRLRAEMAQENYDRAKWRNRELIGQLAKAQGQVELLQQQLREHHPVLVELGGQLNQARADFQRAMERSDRPAVDG